ncbi:chromobox protein homolog 8-like, partial [Ictalurus punctatus]|uniref:Chromobox protein homolog 8-like n=1 Tax=Ictalurus punctatus TaxID=7998 RepID=A0A9F7QXY8_ICTPU
MRKSNGRVECRRVDIVLEQSHFPRERERERESERERERARESERERE